MMRRFFARAKGHLDLVFISDDIAGQQSPLLSRPSTPGENILVMVETVRPEGG